MGTEDVGMSRALDALAQAPGRMRRDARRCDLQALDEKRRDGDGSSLVASLWSLIGELSVSVMPLVLTLLLRFPVGERV